MEDKNVEVLEEKKKDEKHGRTFGVIFIALLLVGLSVACGWFANSYFNNLNKKPDETSNTEKKDDASNTEKKDEKNDEKEKTYTVTEEEAFRLFNVFLSQNTCNDLCIADVKSVQNFDSKSLITINDIDNNTKFNVLLKSLREEDIKTLNSDGGYYKMGQKEISVDTLKKYSLLYFNEEISLPNEFDYFAIRCKQNSSKYICDAFPTGGLATEGWIYVPLKYEVKGNILQIEGISAYDTVEAYLVDKNSNKTYCEDTFVNGVYKNVKNLDCLKKNANNFKKVSMKFDLSNDKYLFISIEK